MTWLIAVASGRWQLHGIQKALAEGFQVFALDGDKDAPGFSLATRHEIVDIRDCEAVVECVRRSGIEPNGAVSLCSEVGMLGAAAIRSEFNLPGSGLEVTVRLIDKALQRDAWEKAGLPNPIWRVIDSEEAALPNAKQIGFPLITKPLRGAGSRGVSRVENELELKSSIAHAMSFSHEGRVIMESILPGSEFTVESFTEAGETTILAVTQKTKVPGSRGTVAMRLVTAELSDQQREQIAWVIRKAVAALGYREGPGHAEIMITVDGEIGLVELAGRGGGFNIFDLYVPIISGFDLARATIRLAVGLVSDERKKYERPAVLRWIPSKKGIVRQVTGFDRAEQIPTVKAGSFVKPGDQLNDAKTDGDRMGYICATGETRTVALARAAEAEICIHFLVEENNCGIEPRRTKED